MPKIEMNMPELPEGWEYTGEYKSPEGFPWADDNGEIRTYIVCTKVPIVRRVPKWRPAKIEDIDKGLKARFWDCKTGRVKDGMLSGWYNAGQYGTFWYDGCKGWNFCEVLDK